MIRPIDQRPIEPAAPYVGWGGPGQLDPIVTRDAAYKAIYEACNEPEEDAPKPFDAVAALPTMLEWMTTPLMTWCKDHYIPLSREKTCYAKAWLLQATLRPQVFGHGKVTVELLATAVGLPYAVMGRVMADFSDKFPSFTRRGQMQPELRQLYRRVQLAARDGKLNELEPHSVFAAKTSNEPPPVALINGDYLEMFSMEELSQKKG